MTIINISSKGFRAGRIILAALAITLAGCTSVRENDVVIPHEAVDVFKSRTAKEIVPLVGPKTFLATFDRYCAENTTNPAKIKTLLKHDGYVPLARLHNEVTVFAHPAGKPLIGLGRKPGTPDLCMVMTRKHKALKSAVSAYVKNKSGGILIDISRFSTKVDQAWIADGIRPKIYMTISDNDPDLGPLFAFAVGQAN